MDSRLFSAAVKIQTLCCILLAAAARLQSEPSLNKQTGNLIVVLIYGQCALEINCSLTHGYPVGGKIKHIALSLNGNSVLDRS